VASVADEPNETVATDVADITSRTDNPADLLTKLRARTANRG
jgi:hypothetical protein